MLPAAATWFDRATSHWRDWDVDALCAMKGAHTVSVVIPARNEASTIAGIAAAISAMTGPGMLVDEFVVIDSDSTDDTARIAADQGATVHAARSIRADLGGFAGKGEALWKSLFVTSGDLLVFIDADLTQWGTHFVAGLLGPLLASPQVHLVRGFYDRALDDGSSLTGTQGGRVTELVARPVINLHWPALSYVVQPLAGEWSIRRATFASLSIPTGYGVEFSTLVDVYRWAGLDAVAQVDLGQRAHSHQSVHDLAVMAAEILAVADRRRGWVSAAERTSLWQFDRDRTPPWHDRPVPLAERPPTLAG